LKGKKTWQFISQTKFFHGANNDHGSAWWKTLVISKSRTWPKLTSLLLNAWGMAAHAQNYTLPNTRANGKIGISPMGRLLVYCLSEKDWDIYAIPASGGDEVDNRCRRFWRWARVFRTIGKMESNFNSTRTGRNASLSKWSLMDLARKQLTMMGWIMVSTPFSITNPQDHLLPRGSKRDPIFFGKDVKLRLLDVQDKKSRIYFGFLWRSKVTIPMSLAGQLMGLDCPFVGIQK